MAMEYKKRREDGFGESVKAGSGETSEEKVTRLERETAYLAYSDVDKDLRIHEFETSQAMLTYQLMKGGII